MAQIDFPVSGTVTDAVSHSPLSGVTITVKGTAIATQSSTGGTFNLNAPSPKSVLVFTYVSYAQQEVALDNKNQITVSLTPSAGSLQDVVVVGYGTSRRGDVTGSIASISAEEIKQVPVTNVTQALQGRVPGLVATANSFRPGSGSTIRIRGNRSLTAGNNPLYVVDGIPLAPENTIDDINPLDIESIDVLKDASATAIYGSRGANGVIQITTKKGKAGRVTVEYSGTTSVDKMLMGIDVFNGGEFAQLKSDALIGSKSYNSNLASSNTTKWYFPNPVADFQLFSNRGDFYSWQSVAMGYTWIDQANLIAAMRPTTAEEKSLLTNLGYAVLDSIAIYDVSKVRSYNWQDEALRTGVTQNHNISLTALTVQM